MNGVSIPTGFTNLEHGRVSEETVEPKIVELTQYNLEEETICRASAIERWACFLVYADRLHRLLPGPGFARAISAAEAIREKTEDRMMYDQHEKARRDYSTAIEGAHLEGLEKGREEERKEGFEKGVFVGKIQVLRQLLEEDAGE